MDKDLIQLHMAYIYFGMINFGMIMEVCVSG